MKYFSYIFVFFFTMQLSAQNNDILVSAYLLKAKNMVKENNYDEAERYLKKVEKLESDNKSLNFLELATKVYTKKEVYKKAKTYADLYFKKQTDKTSNAYTSMLLLYADINDKLPQEVAKKEVVKVEVKPEQTIKKDSIELINTNFYKYAKEYFDKEQYEASNKIIKKFFDNKPKKSSKEYRNMLLLKVEIMDKLEENKKQKVAESVNSNDEDERKTKEVVPLKIIEEVPVFPGCSGTETEKRICLNLRMRKHVARNFNIDLANNLGLVAGKCLKYVKNEKGEEICKRYKPKKYRVLIMFKINEEGKVEDIQARAPHPKLEEEAIRIAKLIPQMKAATQLGKPVRIKYTLPITFNIE